MDGRVRRHLLSQLWKQSESARECSGGLVQGVEEGRLPGKEVPPHVKHGRLATLEEVMELRQARYV